MLGDLVATRLAVIVAISAWRVRRYPENAAYIQAWDDDSWGLLELSTARRRPFARELGAPAPPAATASLRAGGSGARRAPDGAHVRSRCTPCAARASGSSTRTAAGCSTRTTTCRSSALPPARDRGGGPPDAPAEHPCALPVRAPGRARRAPARDDAAGCGPRLASMLVNSGSEANDVAWRIAAGATGRGGASSRTTPTTASPTRPPISRPRSGRRATGRHVAPDPGDWTDADVAAAVARRPLAATFLDAGLTSDGIVPPPPERARALARATREAGGLFVADEVQVGYGRTGEHLWAFAHLGVEPDFVTLGKPMGNGYPVAAVITRRELVERFAFAGRSSARSAATPSRRRRPRGPRRDRRRADRRAREARRRPAPRRASSTCDIRRSATCAGSACSSASSWTTPARARAVVDALRRDGVLIGRTGTRDDVLKIRPPLVFGESHVDLLVAALERALGV